MKKATTITLLVITFFVIATVLTVLEASTWLIAMIGLVIYIAYSSMKENKDETSSENNISNHEK